MSKIENTVSLNAKELKGYLEHIFNTNMVLAESGKDSIAVEIIGESGVGKTSTIMEACQELKLPDGTARTFKKLNISQFEELGDFVGFPVKEYQVAKKNDQGKMVGKWVETGLLEQVKEQGYTLTGKNRMGYATPEWVQVLKEGGVLLVDDWTRAQMRFIQALMEVIDRGEYISWKLPKGVTILLSANPDDGDYFVTSIDKAQRTRFASVNFEFDISVWSQWAEKAGIDGRGINFALLHKELITKNTNARSVVKFFNAISTIKDFSKPESLALIQNIGEGLVGTEFTSMFTSFINNKLDKLITPEEMVEEKNGEALVNKLKLAIGTGDSYRSDIASILTFRFVNYTSNYADNNPVTDKLLERVKLLACETDILSNDLQYMIARELVTKSGSKKFQKLMADPKMAKMVVQ